ncbi:MAG TPA: helix-turn-helix domain-containing protein [Thermoguttaceae bacterium]|nr:helix-turn-helix domain-containing protein [Thermoguttaceae bacterium]
MSKDLTIHDLAKVVGRHPETLRRLARTGKLPGAYRLGHCWLISEQAARKLRCVDAYRTGETEVAP